MLNVIRNISLFMYTEQWIYFVMLLTFTSVELGRTYFSSEDKLVSCIRYLRMIKGLRDMRCVMND